MLWSFGYFRGPVRHNSDQIPFAYMVDTLVVASQTQIFCVSSKLHPRLVRGVQHRAKAKITNFRELNNTGNVVR